MAYMKRIAMPRTWPIPRKGKPRFIMKPKAALDKSVTILVALRDMLKMSNTRKEVKKILKENEIFVNNKRIIEEDFPVILFDNIRIPKIKKFFRLSLSKNGKLIFEDISEINSEKKSAKVIGKKSLKKGKTQINLYDGRNYISDIKVSVNDSVLINLKENKIIKVIPLKEKSMAFVIAGKHIGNKGEIIDIEKEKRGKIISIKTDKKIIKSNTESIFVIEK